MLEFLVFGSSIYRGDPIRRRGAALQVSSLWDVDNAQVRQPPMKQL